MRPFPTAPGTVTVENTGLGGVTVRLSGMADAQTATDNNGQYAFTGLRAGTYAVEISGFDMDEVGFGSVSSSATVGVGESKIISFDGTYLRTAGIMGQVSVEGVGLPNVTVTMTGEGEDETDVTDAGGLYGFSKLKAGTYSIAISGYDPDEVEFTSTSMNVTVALGETANVPFDGTLLRTSGISGRVSVEGMGLDGVEVALTGAAVATAMTSGGGQYAFAGLAEGTYVLNMTNPNETAYTFETTTATIVLGDAESNITNFDGTHTRTASVSGMLFIDEAPADGMYTANEPAFMHAGIPVALQGPGVNDLNATLTGEDGSYAFEGLMAGDYRVLVDYNETVAGMFAAGGFAFKGELTGEVVSVDAGGTASANFPVGITMQTISVSANMGSADGAAVAGVELALYANADMTGMLDEQTTGPTGVAVFNFARAMNTGPGGNDNLVFVNMKSVGADNTGLEPSGNEVIEVSYPGVARVHAAGAAVTLLNTAVNIQFWVKSNMDARGGDMGLEDWATEYCMPMADDAATTDEDESVVCTGEDATFTAMTDADGEAMLTDEEGKGTLSFTADVANLPAMVYVRAADDQSDKLDYGEAYEQTDALMHSHDGLILPADNDPSMNTDELDKGPVYITYTTQSIYVGAHRELDDRTGLTDYIGVGDGDARPSGHAKGKIEVRLMQADERGRLEQYTYDHDNDPETDDEDAEATFSDAATVRFKYVDATAKIVVVADAGSKMTIVPDDRSAREIDAYGDRLDDFPDGIMAGAFGDNSGGRPDVWICPLQRQEDATKNCSTFAYKWEDGTIDGAVGGLQEDDEDVVVALAPVRSNDDYSSDLADDTEIDFDEDGPTEYSFDGIADGKYVVVLEGREGKWQADSTAVITIAHDESTSGGDFDTGAAEHTAKNLSATQLRYAIQGMVGNDRSDPANSLSRSETRSGVTLNLHYASAGSRSAAIRGRRKALGAVMDADGEAMTAETNSDGVYEFTGLRSDTVYVVAAVSEEGRYKVVRGRGSLQAKSDDNMFSQAVVSAAAHDPEFPGEAASPSWDHATGAMSVGGSADFALLFEDATVEGVVSDPSADKAHQETMVELHRCLEAPDGPGVTDGDVNICGSLVPGWPVVTAEVDEDGDWFVEDLLEGHYEVTLDLPQGFVNSDEDGGTGSGGTGYYDSQVASLIDGARTSDDTETFHIVNRRAENGAGAPTALVKMGSVVLTGTGDLGAADNDFVPYDTRSVSLTLTNATGSEGATLKVGKAPFTEKVAGAWGLNAGDNPLMVAVTSANGYVTSGTDEEPAIATEPVVDIHRDRDTRLMTLQIDGNGAASPDDDVLTRARLEAITRFVSSEELQSERIAGVESAAGATVDLGTVSIDKATTQVILTAEAMSETGVMVSFTGTGQSDGTIPFDATDAVTQRVTVTITIVDDGAGVTEDDGRALNTRSYAITFSQPKGS